MNVNNKLHTASYSYDLYAILFGFN